MQNIPKSFARGSAVLILLLVFSTAAFALPPIQYPDPPGDGGSGGGGGGCEPETQGWACPRTYAQSTWLQVWCGTEQGYKTIVSSSCFYDENRLSGCCTFQGTACTYQNSWGGTEFQQYTGTVVKPCVFE